jgi:hypothetical protein
MPNDPLVALYAVAAVIGGLLAFAALLLAGVGVVRRLALPQELPEGPRFEPPPPPLRARPDRAAAREAAVRQEALRALYARGLPILRSAQQCHELLGAAEGVAGVDPAVKTTALAELQRSAATAAAAATAADQALRQLDQELRRVPGPDAAGLAAAATAASVCVDQQALAAQGALAAARAAAAALPDLQGRRRLWLMLGLLAVMVAWVVAMALITRR